MIRQFFIFYLFIISYTIPIYSQFSILETHNLRLIYYGVANSYLVQHTARCFENSLKFHKDLYDYQNEEKITVFIHDLNDYGNAGAGTVPKNHVTIAIAPLNYVYDTSPTNERINTEMNHELAHIVTLDQAANNDKFFRSIFMGKVIESNENPITILYSHLTNPRRNSPRWYREGIAVFLETWMAGGLGRLFSGYDEMVFRTLVDENKQIYDMVGLESEGTKINFQVGVNSYLYGTRFMSYLANKYGPEKLIEWTSRKNDSYGYFVSQFNKVYGISIEYAWDEWIEEENKFQKSNLEIISANLSKTIHEINVQPLGAVSQSFYNEKNNRLYSAVNYPGQIAHIASININGSRVEKLSEVKGAALYYVTHLAYDEDTETLYYTTDNDEWRDLISYNIKTGDSEVLLAEARIGDLAFNRDDKSIWGVRHFNGISTLVRIPYPYEEWNQIYSFPYGKDIYDICVSPNGKDITATLAEISGRKTLIRMKTKKLFDNDFSFETLIDFENSPPGNFIYSNDSKYLYGSSYYTGVSNIYRYDLVTKDVKIISNSRTGLFRPINYKPDSLIAFKFTSDGFLPVIISNEPLSKVNAINFLGRDIVNNHPIVKNWKAGRPSKINIDSLTLYRGSYNGFLNIGMVSAYPIVEGYKNFVSYGARINLSDHLGIHNIYFTGSYTPNSNLSSDERLHLGLSYDYYGWNFYSTLNNADFYDLFGPTKISRKGYSMGLSYKRTLINDVPKTMGYKLNLNYYGNLERLPDYQNVNASFDKLLNLRLSFNFQHQSASLGAVDYEKGIKWSLIFNNNYVNKKIYPLIYNNFDVGFPLPINHSSIWLRTSIGYSISKREEPFANFYFGGFGNNWIDHQHEKQYRNYYSFPGAKINSINGTNFGKLLFEWNLPPIRFRKFGSKEFYVTWMRPAIFSTGIVTNVDNDDYQKTLLNLGAQMDIKIIMLSHLKATFSLGYAISYRNKNISDREFMISLKIM